MYLWMMWIVCGLFSRCNGGYRGGGGGGGSVVFTQSDYRLWSDLIRLADDKKINTN